MVALGASQPSAAFDVVRSAGDVGIALARPAADSAAARRIDRGALLLAYG
jgi:hypothetical protein